MPAPQLPIAVLHIDESCLGNGREGRTPGGAGGLIEVRAGGAVQRRDFYIHAPDTTNNRMALAGAIAALQLLGGKGRRFKVLIVSDSEYLVKGMREWVPGWMSRGWTRKGGPIENLELWRVLVDSARRHEVEWTWVRGHKGHPKNEYANDLAVQAATDQVTSAGAVESGFPAWLEARRAKKMFEGYDPDAAFAALEGKLRAGESFRLRGEE
ncbi:MAG TPA: ribonuclease H [Gemmatimonadales bacterium]|nr:ribonuclease H [Gemmatimonadales bacterium]